MVIGAGPEILGITVAVLENATWAGRPKTSVQWDRGGDGRGHGCVNSGSIRAAEMANVATHEDESVASCPGETGDVANGMTGYVEEIEAAVSEQIMGGKGTYLVVRIEGNFVHLAALEIALEHW